METESAGGFTWFRSYVEVPDSWAGSRLLLVAGEIEGVDEAFFNGEKVGANGAMPPLFAPPASGVRRPFVVEPDQVRFGADNLVAWRVYRRDAPPAIASGPVHLSRNDDAIDLAGTWLAHHGDRPAYAGWLTAEPAAEAAVFRVLAGDHAAGHAGVVTADLAERERLARSADDRFRGNDNPFARSDDKGEPLEPQAALAALRPAPGLALDLVLSEPLVRQPLAIEFDARGRLWLTQYIQYPDPAGLEVLTWDDHLRRVFDAVPPPPPHDSPETARFRGRDVISVHEDSDGDGTFDRHKVFVDGLNLATATAQGDGGVWVLQPPYLLFYPDGDGDDVPDGDPVVHLSGFGLEDTHSVANSLKLGPDGWLYGVTGSTVTARVRAHLAANAPPLAFFGQAVWRYHPRDYRFELFAEGGWNNFGVDFDSKGRLYSGTNGTQQAVYFVQGGFYQKSFGKHGPHTNPYTFGHFGGLPVEGEKIRLVHQWLRYEGGAIPQLEGKLVGPNALASKLHALELAPDGSSFRTSETTNPVTSTDRWFRPVQCAAGPGGALYIADFYDARITHVDPRDNWDRARGRVYRLRANPSPQSTSPALDNAGTGDLVAALSSPDRWRRETARRLLAGRRDPDAVPALANLLAGGETPPQLALEALWALHGLGGLGRDSESAALSHRDPHVRRWMVRLIGDQLGSLRDAQLAALAALAAREQDAEVVSQLAATAGRLTPTAAMAVVAALAARDGFDGDPMVPLQVWWAFEKVLARDPGVALAAFDDSTWWSRPLVAGHLIDRTARRLMAERDDEALGAMAVLLGKPPTPEAASRLVEGMEQALEGVALEAVPAPLAEALASLGRRFPPGEASARFLARLGSGDALADTLEEARQPGPAGPRLQAIATLADLPSPEAGPLFLALARDQGEDDAVRMAALYALRRRPPDGAGAAVVDLLPALPAGLRRAAVSVLASRADWARLLLGTAVGGHVSREAVAFESQLAIRALGDPECDALLREHWPPLRQAEAAKAERAAAVAAVLGEDNPADPARGRVVFEAACGTCHRLGEAGRDIGPDLTGYATGDTGLVVASIIDPNAAIREGFELATLTLRPTDPEAPPVHLAGFITSASDATVTIKDLTGTTTTVPRSEINSESRAAVSAMPEGLLDTLTDQQVRDLFAFLKRQR
jgi:putative heme-binding domain-containing protein